jgi:hypothetical protein
MAPAAWAVLLVLVFCPLASRGQEGGDGRHEARLQFQPDGFYQSFGFSLHGKEFVFKKEPVYSGGTVIRGALPVGRSRADHVGFAWQEEPRAFWLDMNRNGDLTDDATQRFASVDSYGRVRALVTAPCGAFHLPYAVRLHVYPVDGAPHEVADCSVRIQSGWGGTVVLNRTRWHVGVADNMDTVLDGDDVLILKRDKGDSPDFDYTSDPDRLPFPKHLFLDGRSYAVSWAFERTDKRVELVLTFTEEQPLMAELALDGRFIHHLTLQDGETNALKVVVLEAPGETVRIPAGSYNEQRLYVGLDERDLYLGKRSKQFEVAAGETGTLRIGGPLRPEVRADADGADLRLMYALRGRMGEQYRRLLRGDFGVKVRDNTALRPQFTVYKGDKKVAAGTFTYG